MSRVEVEWAFVWLRVSILVLTLILCVLPFWILIISLILPRQFFCILVTFNLYYKLIDPICQIIIRSQLIHIVEVLVRRLAYIRRSGTRLKYYKRWHSQDIICLFHLLVLDCVRYGEYYISTVLLGNVFRNLVPCWHEICALLAKLVVELDHYEFGVSFSQR